MTREDFVQTARRCGYATTEEAAAYAAGREVLTDDDLVVLHRKSILHQIAVQDTDGRDQPEDIWN